jgi:hypothetical protein
MNVPNANEQPVTVLRSIGLVSQPKRIQLSRKRGYRKPHNAVRVTRPGKYGNPYHVGVHGDAAECVALFEAMMKQELAAGRMKEMLAELRGKDLACFCALDAPCHADVLIRLANDQ